MNDTTRSRPRVAAAVALLVAAASVLVALQLSGGAGASMARSGAVTAINAGGHTSCTLDGSGYCTVTHDLGYTPAGVVVTSDRIGQLGTTDQFGATTFRVRWWWHTGALFAAGTKIDFSWVPAGGTVVATSPPTSPTPTATTTSSPPPTTTSPPPTSTPTPTAAACTSPYYTSSGADANGSGGTTNGGYNIRNNVWNPVTGWSQTINVCSYKSWYVDATQPGTGHDDSVKSYPDTQKITSIPLSSMGSITSTFNDSVPVGGGTIPSATNPGKQWNASYDMWLNGLGNVEVMIWNDWTMNWQYWYGQYGGVQVTIDGVAYHAYHNPNATGNSRAMWFVRDNVTTSGTQDIDGVLSWAISKGWLSTSDSLSGIEYGFEIAYTGTSTRFALNDYSLTTS